VTRDDRGQPPKSAAEIEDEIRRTRAELGLTLDALAYQLAPGQLVGKGIDMITQSVKGNVAGRISLGEAVRNNRLPLALIGVGAAWLLARNLGSADGKAEDVHATGSAIIERVEPYACSAKEQARRAGGSLRATFERNPLLIGLAGLVSGAAIAALLPAARQEREWVDKTRDELWKKAEEIGHQAADRVRNLAEHKARAADG
jgi:hypothetical protein